MKSLNEKVTHYKAHTGSTSGPVLITTGTNDHFKIPRDPIRGRDSQVGNHCTRRLLDKQIHDAELFFKNIHTKKLRNLGSDLSLIDGKLEAVVDQSHYKLYRRVKSSC